MTPAVQRCRRWGVLAGLWLVVPLLLVAGLPAHGAAAQPAASQDPAEAASGSRVGAGHCPPLVLPAAPSTPEDAAPGAERGLLWRLQRDGRSSWLYGTLHVGRPGWGRPGPLVLSALHASDTLAVEIDLDDPQVATELAQALREHASAGPAAALPPALVQRLKAATARACLDEAVLASMPPLMQAATLTLADGRWLGLDSAYGQEPALTALARARGLRVAGLETPARQLAALQPVGGPAAQQRQLDHALRQLEDGRARIALMRLAQVWAAGDLQALERYEDWCDCVATVADRQLLHQLNDARNPALADAIAVRHAAGERVFAAVGALHMTGPQALPALLAARGFRVTRVPLSAGGTATAGGQQRAHNADSGSQPAHRGRP